MALAVLRRHQWWLKYILALIVLAFILLYIPMFTGQNEGGAGDVVARVGGLPVSATEFRRAYLRQRQVYERLYQGVDPAMLKRLGLDQQALEGLVNERLVRLEADRLGLRVSDEELTHHLATAPEFQENGRFLGSAEIKRRLEQQGLSEEDFLDLLRGQLLRDKLSQLVTDGVAVSPADVEKEYRRRNERVKAEYVKVDAERFKDQVQVSEEDVRARFQARPDDYRVPEKRVLSYVLVDPGSLRARVALTDRDLSAWYEEHQEELKEPEQVCASHILVKVAAGAEGKGHPEAEAKTLAEGVLAQVKGGADFATVARKSSEDEGSAPGGGDLGCFERGRMVKEFEDAAFDLKPGEISGLVRSSFGFHVIKVASHREASVPALGQVKDRIQAQLLSERARALAEGQAAAIAAAVAKGQALDQVARAQGLTVVKSAPLTRAAGAPPLTSPALLARAFELKKGETAKEPYPAGPAGYAFFAVEDVQAAHAPELKEVEEKVRADVRHDKQLALARELAGQVEARAQKEGLDKAATALGLVRKETPAEVSRGEALGDLGAGAALEAVFSLPEKSLSAPLAVEGGYAVVRVQEKKSVDPAAFEKEKGALGASLLEQRRGELFRAYMTQARQRFSIERYPEAIQKVVG